MSIRFRILLPMVIISVLATSAILFFNVLQFSTFVDNYIEQELERAVLKVLDEIQQLKLKSRTTVLYYMNDNTLIEAMDRRDQSAVLKRAGELFDETEVESLTIVDADGIVLARGHNPEAYGDDASGMAVVRSVLEGEAHLGVERGVLTSVSARAATPIYNSQGRLLGALFAGDRLDTNSFVDKLKTFTGCEITVIIDGVRVATTLCDESGARAIGTVQAYNEQSLLTSEEVTRQIEFKNRELVKKYTPIIGGEGKIIGVISVGKYLDEKQSVVKSFITAGFLIGSLFVLVSVLISFIVSRQIAEPIDYSIDQARYDVLTGTLNRRSLEEELTILLETLSHSGGIVSLMMIDIDFFKNYNDTYGHIKGDDCLKAVASVLTQAVTRPGDFVARYGGEEFVVVLPNTDEAGAHYMAKKMLEDVRERRIPHEQSSVSDYVTVSIGVTTGCVKKSQRSTDFIKQADAMLYKSKRNGRNMYAFKPMT